MDKRTRSQTRITGRSFSGLFPQKKGGRKKNLVYNVPDDDDPTAADEAFAVEQAEYDDGIQPPRGDYGENQQGLGQQDGVFRPKDLDMESACQPVATASPPKKLKGVVGTVAKANGVDATDQNMLPTEKTLPLWTRSFVIASKPCRITDLLPRLSLNQREAIVDIGFGGMLSIRTSELPGKLNKWMLQHFNSDARAVMADEGRVLYYITEEDVEDVFGLPNHPSNPVYEVNNEMYRETRARLQQQYKLTAKLNTYSKINDLMEVMLSLDGGDDFKRLFVVYICSGFLAPATNGRVDYRTLSATQDVSKISELDWCGYVLHKTCEARAKLDSERVGLRQVTFTGCMMLLVVLYLHKITWRGIPEPSVTPLVTNHTFASIHKRLKTELAAGGFGLWMVDETTYPISKRPRERNSYPGSTRRSQYLSFEIPAGVPDDEALGALLENDYHRNVASLVRDLKVVVGDRFQGLLMRDGFRVGRLQPRAVAKNITRLVDEIEDVIRHLEASRDLLESEAETLGAKAFYSTDDESVSGVSKNHILPPGMQSAGHAASGSSDEITISNHCEYSQAQTVQINVPSSSETTTVQASVVSVENYGNNYANIWLCHSNPPWECAEQSTTSADNNGVNLETDCDTINLDTRGDQSAPGMETRVASGEVHQQVCVRDNHPVETGLLCSSINESQPKATPHWLLPLPDSVNSNSAATTLLKESAAAADDIYSSLEALNSGTYNQTREQGSHHTLALLDLLSDGVNDRVTEAMTIHPPEGIVDLNMQLPFEDTDVPLFYSLENSNQWSDSVQPQKLRFLTKLVQQLVDEGHVLPTRDLEIADFCITRAHMATTRNNTLYTDGLTSLQRSQFNSLEANTRVSPSIISVWSRVLNESPLTDYPSGHVCLELVSWEVGGVGFLERELSLILGWEAEMKNMSREIVNATMVFVPVVLDEQYFLLVVNFKEKLVEYFDSRIYRGVDTRYVAAKHITCILSTALASLGHEQGRVVTIFKLTTPAGPWASDFNGCNAGVIVMQVMKYYSGDALSLKCSATNMAPSVEQIRASVATTIVMSGCNWNREMVLELLPAHIDAKSILPVGTLPSTYSDDS